MTTFGNLKHVTFASQIVTGSQLVPYFTYLYTTTFILLIIFHSRDGQFENLRDHTSGMRNVPLQFPSVTQKHRLLKLSDDSFTINTTREEMTNFTELANNIISPHN